MGGFFFVVLLLTRLLLIDVVLLNVLLEARGFLPGLPQTVFFACLVLLQLFPQKLLVVPALLDDAADVLVLIFGRFGYFLPYRLSLPLCPLRKAPFHRLCLGLSQLLLLHALPDKFLRLCL